MRSATIYIIGAGAIGKALAVFLTHQGKEVFLLRGRAVKGPAYLEEITIQLNEKRIIRERVSVSSMDNFTKLEGIIVLTNKSLGNEAIALNLRDKVNYSPIVLLQNGLNIEKIFTDLGFSSIYRCVLLVTSQPLSDNVLRFKPVSISPVGKIKGDAIELNRIVEQLSNPYFEFNAAHDIIPLTWSKVIVNVVFNSVCPLLETDNGIFHRNPEALDIAKRVIAECIKIAALKEVFLDPETVLQRLLQISKLSEGQFISTYQDIKNKNRTEIDTLNFAIVNIANEFKCGNAIPATKLLGELVKIKSELTMQL